MRFCLLYPPRPGGRGTNLVPPIGLLYLAAVLEREGHEVVLLDATLMGVYGEELAGSIAATRPDVLGMTAFTSDMPALRRDLPAIRSELPGAQLWIGGPHPSAVGAEVLEELPQVDAVFLGEAEESILEMIDHLGSGSPLPEGVIVRGAEAGTRRPRHIADLGSLPLPAWHHARPALYRGLPNGVVLKRLPYAPILTTRGCPFSCTFCAGFRVTGKRLRHRPMGQVWEEIELLHAEYGVREIHIEDDNFTLDSEYARRFCREAIDRALPLHYSTPNGVRLDTLDDELLELMRSAGWYALHCGIESGSDRVLERARKGITTRRMLEAIAMIRSHRLQVAGYFILGLPGEEESDILQTIDFARSSRIEWAQFACFLPIPGSEDGERWFGENPGARGDWETFHNTACPAPPKGMTRRRLKQLQKRAFLCFYLRPAHILRVLGLMFHRGTTMRLIRRFFAYLAGSGCPG